MPRTAITFYYCLCALLFVTGCSSLEQQLAHSESLFLSGQYHVATAPLKISAQPTSEALLSNLYRASIHLMDADFTQFLADLEFAEAGLEEQDNTTNWGNHYLGRTYDGLMVQTYRGLAYLFLGNPAYARVAFNRLELRQGEASRRNQRSIEKTQKKIANERNTPKNQNALIYLDKVAEDSNNRAKLDAYQHLLDQWGAYADYESPIGRFLSGLFRLFYMEDPNDAEKAVFQLKRAYGMTESKVARQLYDLAEMLASGKIGRERLENCVVVLFENGMGPAKEENRYEFFIPFYDPVYVGIALPVLVEQEAAYPHLTLLNGTQRIGQTSLLCSIDRLVASEFRKELPWIIAKEITTAVIKVALQITATETARKKNGDLAAFLVGVSGSTISYCTTKADVLGWNLLPKEYQAALIPRPKSGILGIATPNSSTAFTEVVLPHGPTLVYVKIPVAGLPALVKVISPDIR